MHVMQHSLHVRNVEGSREFRPMDTCVGYRIVEYLFTVHCPHSATSNQNIKFPDGATYSQTVYVPRYHKNH